MLNDQWSAGRRSVGVPPVRAHRSDQRSRLVAKGRRSAGVNGEQQGSRGEVLSCRRAALPVHLRRLRDGGSALWRRIAQLPCVGHENPSSTALRLHDVLQYHEHLQPTSERLDGLRTAHTTHRRTAAHQCHSGLKAECSQTAPNGDHPVNCCYKRPARDPSTTGVHRSID